MQSFSHLKFFIGIGILTIGILSIHMSVIHPIIMYSAAFIASSLAYCWMCWMLFRCEVPVNTVIVCLALAVVVRLSFLTTIPIGSDDVYRYMWDGKVQAAGINPYSNAPSSPALSDLHSSLLPGSINHPDMKTLYFPLSEWVFAACYQLSGEAIWGYKLMLIISEIATCAGLLLLSLLLKQSPRFVLFYALCPLSIVEFAIDSHLDAFGFPFLIFGLAACLQRKTLLSSILLGISASVKPVLLVLLPVLVLHEQSWRKRIAMTLVPVFVLVIQFVPYAAHSRPFDALFTFAEHWSFNGALFETAYLYFADNLRARLFCAVLLGASLVAIYFMRRGFFDKIYLSLLALLILSPVVHP